MSLAWPASADVPALPVPPSQLYPLPLPPPASALPVAAPPPVSLPVPAPPSLDSARLKLALDKIKLELESTREALDELRALVRDADAALRAEADERENALEQQVVSAVRDLLSSQLAPLRSSLSSLSDKLAGLPTHSDSDCEQRVSNAVNGAVRDAEQRLRAAVQGVERGWAGELARAQDEARAEIRALKERFGEAERRAESEKARADGLEERVGKVEGEVSMLRRLIEERTATPTLLREPMPLAHAHTVVVAHNLVKSSQPPLVEPSRAHSVLLALASTSTANPQATTSSDSPASSPPRKRRRRLFPSNEWQATAVVASTGALEQQQQQASEQGAKQPRGQQSSSLPLIVDGSEGGRSTNDPAAAQRARSAPSGPGAATSTKSGLVRSSTKRRVIEQDESSPEQAEEQERGERGEQVKRWRMIEQDATPAETQEEAPGGDAGGIAWVGGEDEEAEEGEEPDTLE